MKRKTQIERSKENFSENQTQNKQTLMNTSKSLANYKMYMHLSAQLTLHDQRLVLQFSQNLSEGSDS